MEKNLKTNIGPFNLGPRMAWVAKTSLEDWAGPQTL